MRAEYDFSKGARGKYAKSIKETGNVVVLSPDVSKAFPDSKSVNQALRGLLKLSESVSRAQNKRQPQSRKTNTTNKTKRNGTRR